MKLDEAKQEASLIGQVVKAKLARRKSKVITGEEALREMFSVGDVDGVNYGFRQIEWPGFYFEFMCLSKAVRDQMGWDQGPGFGPGYMPTQRFDLQKDYVWDLKCHADSAGSTIILNDCDALDNVFPASRTKKHQGVGFVILCGKVVADEDNAFRAFRKGFVADPTGGYRPYSNPNKKYRRILKASFEPTNLKVFYLHERTPKQEAAMANGILLRREQGHNRVNKGGSQPTRPEKYHLKMSVIDERGTWLLDEKL